MARSCDGLGFLVRLACLVALTSGLSHSHGTSKIRQHPRLKVGFAIFITDISIPQWEDALRILAFGVLKAKNTSRHDVHLLALTPERFSLENEEKLKTYGFEEVVRKPVPVPVTSIIGHDVKYEMSKTMGGDERSQFALEEEQIKYWGLTLTDYDRVLVLDADVMILDPMDDLMEVEQDFAGVYDWGLDGEIRSVLPPTQGGFLLFRPNMSDFEAVRALQREGDWNGEGWKGSRIGYAYGGAGPDGLLAYYFNKDALPSLSLEGKASLLEGIHTKPVPGSRMLAVERPIYDIVLNEKLEHEVENTNHELTVANAKSVHFTGNCIKPWTCFTSGKFFCAALLQKWWELRAETAAAAGLSAGPASCVGGVYEVMKPL